MAEIGNILGQAKPAAGTLVNLYSGPSSGYVVVTTIVCSNVSGISGMLDYAYFSIARGGAVDDPSQYHYFQVPIDPGDANAATWGMLLSPGDVIRVKSDNGNIAFTAYGLNKS